ncbi:MAG: SusC/RagA family TonB-linked outer membrane protein [Bacteroidia bacterium]|nr:MAG: SusC/RagA family TonB-linked outer membrane protein [Bacteroidia bacterium]
MRKIVLLIVMLMTVTGYLFAQQGKISGKVVDAQGNPIPFASITVANSSIGTSASEDGTFSIVAKPKQTLAVSATGYESKEVAATQNITIVLKLSTGIVEDEVVVLGYGSGKRLSSTVGAVDRVSATRLKERPAASMVDGLQGQFPGLQIFTSSGEPSATSSFRLHGVSSLGASSTPLIILDGVQVGNGSLVSLSPQDIESYTLLKDASSTSIYGARAANGVLVITTKKGKFEQAPTINFGMQYGVSNPVGIKKKQFDQMLSTDELLALQVATGQKTQAQADAIKTQYPGVSTNWYDTYYRKDAPYKQANLALTGGGKGSNYYVSGTYFSEDGSAWRSTFDRFTLRANLNTIVTKWLKFGLNLSGGVDERSENPYGSNSTNRGLSPLRQPWFSPVDSNGKRYDFIPGVNAYHPEYLAEKILSKGTNYQFNPSAYIEINPLKGLVLRTQGGYDAYIYRSSSATLPSYLGSLKNGSASESFDQGVQRTFTHTAEYAFNINTMHSISVLGGYEWIDYKNNSFGASSAGQTDDRVILLGAGPNSRNVSQGKADYAFESIFGRATYSLDKKYFLDGTIRQDASSRFGANNKKAIFWSAGLMWAAKKESFLENVDWINELNVRLSTGTSGNSEIGNYVSQALVGVTSYDAATGWVLSSPGNPNLTWEEQNKTLLNIQLGLFKKARLDVSIYNRNTKNQLVSVPQPYTTGFASITQNVGSLNNKGVDVRVDFDVVKTRDAFFTPYVTAAYNKNKITELFQGRDYWIIPNTGVAWVVGQPITYIYPLWKGVNTENGKPEWYLPETGTGFEVKTQKDPTKVTNTFSAAGLNQNTGIQRYAPWSGGFGFQSGWKGFYFNTDFSFVKGKYMINNDNYFLNNPNQFSGFNTRRETLDYWKQAGDVTKYPAWSYRFSEFDSRLIEDASFLRLKTLMLGYNLPKTLLEKAGFIKGASIYLTGRNLITTTKYTGPDPEVDSNLGLGTNPNTKNFGFGVNLQF